MKKGRAVIIGIAVVDVVVLVVFVVLSVMKAMRTATIDVLLAPRNAVLVINGQEYGSGAYKIYPGKVTAEIVADGFVSKSVELELKDGEITRIYTYLLNAKNGFSWYENDLDELENLKRVGGDAELGGFLKKMTIREILPYYYNVTNAETDAISQFVVEEDTIDCPESFCLQAVNMKNSTNELIKEVMEKEGYDLDEYTVYYF